MENLLDRLDTLLQEVERHDRLQKEAQLNPPGFRQGKRVANNRRNTRSGKALSGGKDKRRTKSKWNRKGSKVNKKRNKYKKRVVRRRTGPQGRKRWKGKADRNRRVRDKERKRNSRGRKGKIVSRKRRMKAKKRKGKKQNRKGKIISRNRRTRYKNQKRKKRGRKNRINKTNDTKKTAVIQRPMRTITIISDYQE